MSEVIQKLITEWIEKDTPTQNFQTDFSSESYEDIKASVPNCLKRTFKVICIQKKLKIRVVIGNLIQQWLKT